jgi:hypothetical protein
MKTVPPAPEPFTIDEEAKQNLEKWVSHFKGLSSRIRVVLPSDKSFDLNLWQGYTKATIYASEDPSEIELIGWPQKESVAFLICINSSMEEGVNNFAVDNAFLFCFNDKAFGLDYFELFETKYDPILFECSLDQYPETALNWLYIAKIIKGRLQEIEKRVPKFNV